jgi:hypothetical protein
MSEKIDNLITSLKAGDISFVEVLAFIEKDYLHTPTAFKNGEAYNEATQNQGSAKVFAFAIINNITEEDTLYLFAEHYQAVLASPEASDHQNIRQFMINGFAGIEFEGVALTAR